MMTIQEALYKIKKLENYIDELENNTENDKLFLLSVEEYEKYKNVIPKLYEWWWLRSPCSYDNHVADVCSDGSIVVNGLRVYDVHQSARPALKFNENQYDYVSIGQSFYINDKYLFTKIDNDLAISTGVLIRDCRFDSKSNNYATSEIRQKLNVFYEENLKEYLT